MPSWKKVVVSGSDATLNSLFVSTAVTASIFSGSYIGNLTGTASYVTGSVHNSSNPALSASYALTASYALNAGGGGGAITIADEGAAQGTATFLNFIGNAVTATVSANTASINIAAAQGTGSVTLHTQASPAVTWSFNHKLNNLYPVLNVWDSNGFTVIPGGIKSVDANNIEIYFKTSQAGYASAVVGGTAISASFAVSSSFAATASFFQVFPFTGSAQITGSLGLTGSFSVSGSTIINTQQNSTVNIGTSVVATVPTASMYAAFFDYIARSGSTTQNMRAGTVISTWNTLGTVQYTDNSTPDIGDTSGVTLAAVANGSNVELRATVSTNSWNIKTFVRSI